MHATGPLRMLHLGSVSVDATFEHITLDAKFVEAASVDVTCAFMDAISTSVDARSLDATPVNATSLEATSVDATLVDTKAMDTTMDAISGIYELV